MSTGIHTQPKSSIQPKDGDFCFLQKSLSLREINLNAFGIRERLAYSCFFLMRDFLILNFLSSASSFSLENYIFLKTFYEDFFFSIRNTIHNLCYFFVPGIKGTNSTIVIYLIQYSIISGNWKAAEP